MSKNSDLDYLHESTIDTAIELAKKNDDKVTLAILHVMAGTLYKRRWDERKSKKHYKEALADIELLASTPLDEFEELFEKGEDDKIFDESVLWNIGIETEQYDILKKYYKNSGNRTAACYAEIRSIMKKYDSEKDSITYKRLMNVVKHYEELPIICEAVRLICVNNLLPYSELDGIERTNEYAERKWLRCRSPWIAHQAC